MASYPKPNIVTFQAGGTIVKGHAVKIGADASHVVECTATTDLSIGISNTSTTTSDDPVEVFMGGGGAAGKAGATIAKGKKLMSTTDGTLIEATTGKEVVGVALDAASSGDLFPVFVGLSTLP